MEKKHVEHYNPGILKGLVERYPMGGDAMKIGDYLDGRGPYTYDEVSVLSKWFKVPFGYFFLDELPPEIKPSTRIFEDGYYWAKQPWESNGLEIIKITKQPTGIIIIVMGDDGDSWHESDFKWIAESPIEEPKMNGASPLKMPEDTKPVKKYLVKEVRSYQSGYVDTIGCDLTADLLASITLPELSGKNSHTLMTLIKSFSDKETVIIDFRNSSVNKLL